MTAYVDDNGKLVVRDDVYGLDRRTTAILKGDDIGLAATYTSSAPKPPVIDAEKRRALERIVSDAGRPIELTPSADGRGVLAPFEPGSFHSRDGFDFFDRLFR
jgi:hypothetical protein